MSVFWVFFFGLNRQHLEGFQGHKARGRERYTPVSSFFQLVSMMCYYGRALHRLSRGLLCLLNHH